MYIENIKSSNDLKKLTIKEKTILASEIRNYILEVVSKNGGHLASNLGIVELTLAIESIFDLSKDKIVWDVGHQCYTHKIINGRYKTFKTLRKLDGIAGFPKYTESTTDVFNTGHSSTSISAALGLAAARDISKKDYNVIAVIGDGALTGGMAMEALNHAGSTKTKLLVILNDNEMSISKNIGGINNLLTNLRIKKNYTKSNAYGKEVISKIPFIGSRTVKVVGRLKDTIKQAIIPGMYFEEIGFRYLGPVDGHDLKNMEDLLRKAKELDGPTIIHVLTKKGKGYLPAEENSDCFHGVSSFDIETGKPLSKKKDDYSKIFGKKLVELAKKNKKIIAITAAMRDGTGLKEFFQKYPNRFFDVGIAEQHALTFAAGLARGGMIPVVSIYSSFYQRAYDQVIHDICLQELPVVMCVDRAGIVGNDGETHQGLYDMAFFNLIPNITIMAPKDFCELENMLEFAISLNKPVVIRYPRGGESQIKMTNKKIDLGKSEILHTGCDLTILAIGKFTSYAEEVRTLLEKDGYSVEVINCRFLKPLDEKTILKSIRKTKHIAVMEDGTIKGGLSSSIKDLIVANNLIIKSIYFAYPDEFIKQGTTQEIEKKYKLDVKNMYNRIKKMVKE